VIYLLGDDIELNVGTVELIVGGDPLPVEPQVYNVLSYLVANAERVVTKEELLDNVWGDRFVSESALTSRIKTARRAVGDDGKAQRMIRTVHGRGYRWVGPIAVHDNTATNTASNSDPGQTSPVIEPAGHPSPTHEPTKPNGVNIDAPVDLSADAMAQAQQVDGEGWPLVGRADELATLSTLFHHGRSGGVLLTGSAGAGKSRLADEVVGLAARGGAPVSRIRGHAEVKGIPFACLAHLLPTDFAAISGPDGNLSKGLLLQSAARTIAQQAGAGRLVLLVDDIDRVDELSLAVISSLAQGDRVFVVATQRTDADTAPALEHLVDDGVIERVDLGPLPADVLGVALYRSLGAPLDSRCMAGLIEAGSGSPGLLRQLVESSIHTGTLQLRDGVWTLTGDLSPPNDLIELVEGRLADLDAQHREAAELMAIAGTLDLEIALDLVGEEILDALDLRGMLAMEDGSSVQLAHPTFGDVLRSKLRPFRQRRLRLRLADALTAAGAVRPGDRLRIARWRLEGGDAVDPETLMEGARLAVVEKDNEMARRLITRLEEQAPSPELTQLKAEIAFRQGSPDEVERLLQTIDLDAVSPTVRAQLVRRRTTNMFFGLVDNTTPFDILDDEIAKAGGEAKIALQSQRLALGVMVGDLINSHGGVDDIIIRATDGYIRLELLRTLSYTSWALGDPAAALDIVTAANKMAAGLVPSLSRPGLGLTDMVEAFASMAVGDVDRARSVAERVGAAVTFGWRAVAAGRLAVYQGLPTSAVELLANPVGYADALGQDFVAAWMRLTMAEAEVSRGRIDVAVELQRKAAPMLADRGRTVDVDMAVLNAIVSAAAGHLDQALDDLMAAARRAGELNFVIGVLLALQTASRLGSPERALATLDELNPRADFHQARCQVDEIRARAADDHDAMVEVARRYEGGGLTVAAARLYDSAGATEDRDRLVATFETGFKL
jgi:DNA-binding winged helix-turn-helix (wHTH) protein